MTDVWIDDFDDLDRVAQAMDQVGDQAQQLGDFMRTWVCRRAGFETSDLCLLRPLGGVVGEVAAAFDDFVGRVGTDWRELAAGVLATRRALADADDQAVSGLERMLA